MFGLLTLVEVILGESGDCCTFKSFIVLKSLAENLIIFRGHQEIHAGSARVRPNPPALGLRLVTPMDFP